MHTEGTGLLAPMGEPDTCSGRPQAGALVEPVQGGSSKLPLSHHTATSAGNCGLPAFKTRAYFLLILHEAWKLIASAGWILEMWSKSRQESGPPVPTCATHCNARVPVWSMAPDFPQVHAPASSSEGSAKWTFLAWMEAQMLLQDPSFSFGFGPAPAVTGIREVTQQMRALASQIINK